MDGYNLPMGVTYIPSTSTPPAIPPNFTNCACVALAGHTTAGATNGTFPTPYNTKTTNADLAHRCPWDLQLNPPAKPGDGVSPYPAKATATPAFPPCLSDCAKTDAAADCCTGAFDSPATCTPNLCARAAKAVCPAAYSYALDDAAATSIVPSGGGGWDVASCPAGALTNILEAFGDGTKGISQTRTLSADGLARARNTSLIQQGGAASRLGLDGRAGKEQMRSLGALVVVLAWACFW